MDMACGPQSRLGVASPDDCLGNGAGQPRSTASQCTAVSELFHFTTDDQLRRAVQFRREIFKASGNLDEETLAVDEDFDACPNCMIVGIVEDGGIRAVMRIHVLTRAAMTSPARFVFPDVLDPELDRGFSIIDSSGFCVRSNTSRERIDASGRLLSASIYVANRLSPSKMIATARGNHGAFYRRVFGGNLVCQARSYPGRRHPLSLYIQDTGDLMTRLECRGEPRFLLGERDRGVVDEALKDIFDKCGQRP